MRGAADTIQLGNGVAMPRLGLGTWKMDDDEAKGAVQSALESGYRLIDTATLYRNERGVGAAIRASALPREEIFLTTKLFPTGFTDPMAAFEASRERLGLEYVDLYLIHWPIPFMPASVWKTLERIYESKRARAIGVSNYGIDDIEQLMKYAKVPPAVNQIKFSPFDYEPDVLEYCRDHDVVVEAYSPLTRGTHLAHPIVVNIAKKYGKSPAQILIRWCIEHETVPIPKSSHPGRIRENAQVFDISLTHEEMRALDSLS